MAPVGFITRWGQPHFFTLSNFISKWYFLVYMKYTWYTIYMYIMVYIMVYHIIIWVYLYNCICLHLGTMNYSSQVWQYMANGSSRLPMDSDGPTTCWSFSRNMSNSRASATAPFRGRENMVPPQMSTSFVGNIWIFTWKQKRIWYVL